MTAAFVELNEAGTKMCVYFPFNMQQKNAVKAIPGSRFVPADKAGPDGIHWTVPLDMDAARTLRIIFGDQLTLGEAVKEWGLEEAEKERNLGSLSIADDAELVRVPEHAPMIERLIAGDPFPEFGLPKKHALSKKRDPRPYQRADIAMMAQANVLNANGMGTGKTIEVLGAVVEGELDAGPHLVCAPKTSLENVWRIEIERWLGHPVYTAETPAERRIAVAKGLEAARRGETCWVLVIYDDLRVRKLDPESTEPVARRDHKGNMYAVQNAQHTEILGVKWNSFTIDEFHVSGLNSPLSLFTLGIEMVKAKRHFRMSGTPMGGKPINLFPVLRSIEPKKFSSKWRWAEEWLEVDKEGYGWTVGGIQPGKEEEFYRYHSRYMVRRLKKEALPGLPKKVIEDVYVDMTPKQKKQYEKFAMDAEVRITEQSSDGASRLVVTDCILAEYSRLKQFSNAYCEINDKGQIVPTEDSGKLSILLAKLAEQGISKKEYEPGSRAIIASESKRMVEMVAKWLKKQGISCDMLTGDTKDSTPIIRRFQEGSEQDKPYVIVMTTQTGGVSLNLERANSVHILDEMWNPDRQTQLEDRGDRGTRTTPLVCLYYRTRGTIQEKIAQVAEGKKITNANVLDVYRQIQRLEKSPLTHLEYRRKKTHPRITTED